ncbi:hypothetical protein PtB15_10B433 [Puccinia triticina]|nr:hypothetical protein PtB15_10B433 [Puccinia triticina]
MFQQLAGVLPSSPTHQSVFAHSSVHRPTSPGCLRPLISPTPLATSIRIRQPCRSSSSSRFSPTLAVTTRLALKPSAIAENRPQPRHALLRTQIHEPTIPPDIDKRAVAAY